MQGFLIEGVDRLKGEIRTGGAKNAALPIIAACLLIDGEVSLHDCPGFSDVYSSVRILSCLGCTARAANGEFYADCRGLDRDHIPDKLMRLMRSSSLYLGALLGRLGSAYVSYPGGCELGSRPIDLHLAAFEKMGVSIHEEHGVIECTAPGGVHGASISLSFPSVGATENIILAAVLARGETVIYGAAREPEISDLSGFLRKCGAKITGDGTSTVRIHGVKELHGCEYTVMPDRIAAATYMCTLALAGGELVIDNINESQLRQISDILTEAGCDIYTGGGRLYISRSKPLKSVSRIRTMPYPGFPTDAQPLVTAVLSRGKGTSIIVENIFENRFSLNGELVRMGADIKTEGRIAVIEGVEKLYGARVMAKDLRAGAALVCAAVSAEGVTELGRIEYIDRGYEHLEDTLSKIGAKIKRTAI
ncbi:MAG: UDP-N-acetylglucosamine 1-carboxyvinyltransferase [Ruminococcus sp.]|nr:UDP-N-acetylglucosamine 1-carboxyvinyltransferase [Ruminococcus sp.]MBR1750709.1 UDP-N-acetylglucosamine 1-carboxyvinyltransferase [Ruminococcus sp.]